MSNLVHKWQLYDISGAELAAMEIESALAKAVAKRKEHCSCSNMAILAARDVQPVMTKHRDFGALDTEPQCVLVDMVEDAFGLDRGTIDRWEI